MASTGENSEKKTQPMKLVILADLNVDPPEFDEEDTNPFIPSAPLPPPPRLTINESSQEKFPLLVKEGSDVVEGEARRLNKVAKCRSRSGKEDHLDCGMDADGDQQSQGAPSSREEKVSSLKTGLIHVARKAPKNAHAHFLLGLMYQRLVQPQKAVLAYEKAAEILLRSDEEIDRPELLSLVQMHHAQCLLLESLGEGASDKELEAEELEEIISKLKESVLSDIRQVPIWNTLGVILLKTGRLESAISVMSSLLALEPHNLDCLANLGLAHLQSGNVDAASKCFQELILKDQGHPSALVNYAALLLCKYGSAVAGAGASSGEAGAESDSAAAINVAKECLLAAVKADPKAAHTWANLASGFKVSMLGDLLWFLYYFDNLHQVCSAAHSCPAILPYLLFVMCGKYTFMFVNFLSPIYAVIFLLFLFFFSFNYELVLICLHRFCFLHNITGVVRYPYPPIARPPFLRPGVGMVPPLQRPPVLGLRPAVILPLVRPPVVPIVVPAEKPQTTVYVGKIAPSVENDFIHSLLELCGPIKSWKRAQDPSDGTPRRFGFCEFESAEGVLRALRLLTKCNVDGEELVLNVNQATREYLECYVEKKKDNLTKSSETGIEEAKKEGGNVSDVEKGESNEKEEPAKVAVEEAKKDADETENKENDTASFGLVTDEDRDVDRETLEKLTSMIEERIKTKPLPPPPPPQKIIDGMTNLNCEVPSKSWDKDSDVETLKNEDRMDNETTSETKPSHRAGTESPDRSRRYDNRSRDRDRDRRDKERELDRLERERERERARRERERDLEIQKAERFYKEQVKEWEIREKEREYERKREREKEKERERERRRLIADQEDESDDDSRKRRRKSEIEDKRRRRRREKEDDLADRLKEEEEIVEAKKRAEEERQRQLEKEALRPPVQLDNGSDKPISLFPEVAASEIKDGMEVDHDSVPVPAPSPSASAPAPVSYNGDGNVENGYTEEPAMVPDSLPDVKLMGNAPAKKLGFGLLGSGKRTAVPSVFHEEEDDDAQKDKKMRPLVPIDYSTEELQAVHTNVGEAPQISAASADSNKRNNSREAKSDVEKDRSRRYNDRSSHWDRQRDGDEAPRVQDILDAKQLIDMIPKTKADLFSYEINWAVYDENRLHERMRPWISKKIAEFLGEEETTLVEFIVDRFREHVQAEKMLDVLQRILDEEAEMFVLKMWRMLIFEIKKVETGLTTRPES